MFLSAIFTGLHLLIATSTRHLKVHHTYLVLMRNISVHFFLVLCAIYLLYTKKYTVSDIYKTEHWDKYIKRSALALIILSLTYLGRQNVPVSVATTIHCLEVIFVAIISIILGVRRLSIEVCAIAGCNALGTYLLVTSVSQASWIYIGLLIIANLLCASSGFIIQSIGKSEKQSNPKKSDAFLAFKMTFLTSFTMVILNLFAYILSYLYCSALSIPLAPCADLYATLEGRKLWLLGHMLICSISVILAAYIYTVQDPIFKTKADPLTHQVIQNFAPLFQIIIGYLAYLFGIHQVLPVIRSIYAIILIIFSAFLLFIYDHMNGRIATKCCS